MKFLQQAVGLRGYAQRDPLAEYKLEGYELFLEMMAAIRRNTVHAFPRVLATLLRDVCLGRIKGLADAWGAK